MPVEYTIRAFLTSPRYLVARPAANTALFRFVSSMVALLLRYCSNSEGGEEGEGKPPPAQDPAAATTALNL